MPIQTLTGYSLPAQLINQADHTYVGSSSGLTWGCWGRSSGGTALSGAQNQGDETIADCISQVSSHAGIVYAVTGVCHQTANRILAPANVTVSSARGYGISRAFYGTYGLNIPVPGAIPWPKKMQACLPPSGGTGGLGGGNPGPGGPNPPNDSLSALQLAYSASPPAARRGGPPISARGILIAEAAAMAAEASVPFQSREFSAALETHIELFIERERLVDNLLGGALNGEAYAKAVNDLVATKFFGLSKRISRDAYVALYGVQPGERVDPVDPEIASKFMGVKRVSRPPQRYNPPEAQI